jgi:hypothetical protein
MWPRRAGAEQITRADALRQICQIAAKSEIASYKRANRGVAPGGYVKGMAVSFAKVYAMLGANDAYAMEMARAAGSDASKDALTHYEEIFKQAQMDNSQGGADALRHLFVLMLGLGMRESSGRYCEGRDRSANNTSAETAEAGLFQTSWNARHASELMPKLFKEFSAKAEPSYIEIFKEGVRPRGDELENYGSGDGRDFQKLSKESPFFALLFAGIGLRNIRKHWGPINRRAAEVKAEADAMFKQVQKMVDEQKLGAVL